MRMSSNVPSPGLDLAAGAAMRGPRGHRLLLLALVGAVLIALGALAVRPATGQEIVALPNPVASAIEADAAALAGVEPGEVSFARAQSVTWSDGCLGIYAPNILCTDALVEGFVVWAVADGEGFRYHTSMTGAQLAARGLDPASIATAPLPDGITGPTPPPNGSGTVSAGQVPLTGGFGLIVFDGGSYDQLLEATGCPLATARFWATVDGAFVVLIPGSAVAAPNAEFDAAFGDFIPFGTPLIATCPPDAETTTGIAGIVTHGPLTPICTAGVPCDAPLIATLAVRTLEGVEIARTTSASTGWYLIGVEPGTYILDPIEPPGPFPFAGLMEVVVPDEGFAIVNLSFDSGIR